MTQLPSRSRRLGFIHFLSCVIHDKLSKQFYEITETSPFSACFHRLVSIGYIVCQTGCSLYYLLLYHSVYWIWSFILAIDLPTLPAFFFYTQRYCRQVFCPGKKHRPTCFLVICMKQSRWDSAASVISCMHLVLHFCWRWFAFPERTKTLRT